MRARLAAAVAVVALATGCTDGAGPTPTPGPTSPASTASGRPTATTPPSPTASPTPADRASPTPAAPVPTAPPPAATAPAPSTAGGLTGDDVARPEGWEPTARPGSPDEGWLGNGTWVHATSAEHSAYAAIALGCSEIGPYRVPVAALEGSLTDPEGRAGVGLTLEFASAEDARGYFDEWVRQAQACLGSGTERIESTSDTWLGRRVLDTVWSEAVGVRGDRVLLLIVEAPDADLTSAIPAG